MLTYEYRLPGTETISMTPFLAKALNKMADKAPGLLMHWQGDPERFQLVANETVKVGQPVNRDDALYWIGQIKTRAMGPTELIGWVKAN